MELLRVQSVAGNTALDTSNPIIGDENMLSQFYQQGWTVIANFLPDSLNRQLLEEARFDANLTPAGVGRARDHTLNRQVRRDKTQWFEGKTQAQQHYLELMQQLKQQLNRQFFLGLFDFECHFACYQQGDFYQKHFDAFSGRSNRVLTTVSYLNNVNAGGELVLYGADDSILSQITPQAGSLVLFESERFAHEVLTAVDDRYSVAGWFRHNNSINGAIDPSR